MNDKDIDDLIEDVNVEIAKNRTLLGNIDDEERLFIKSAMEKAELNARNGRSEPSVC